MKFLAIALGLIGVASAGSLSAQVTRPTSSGSVIVPTRGSTDCGYARTSSSVGDIIFGRRRGRDNSSIYERRVRNARGDLVIQRARRNPNGSFTILSTRVATSNDKEWKKAQKAQQKALKKQEKEESKAEKEYYKGSR